MEKGKNITSASAIDIIEEAVSVLRRFPAVFLLPYYVGTLPFVMGFLYFWGDMSKSASAGHYLGPASLGLAFLFVWMKYWHAVFSQRILMYLKGDSLRNGPRLPGFREAAFQGFIHGTSFFVLPVAALLSLPFGWVYAFYQTCPAAGFASGKSMKTAMSETFRIASMDPKQNHMAIVLLWVFKLVVTINIGICIYSLPYLAKSLLGIDTAISMGGYSLMNSTFILSVLFLTNLCVDPLVKTVYTVRYFYGISRQNGTDLIAGLKRMAVTSAVILFAGFAVIQAGSGTARADGFSSETSREHEALEPGQLQESIDYVLKQRDFTWRMPREEVDEDDTPPGMIESMAEWIENGLKSLGDVLEKWIDKIGDFMKRLFPEKGEPLTIPERAPFSPAVRYLLYALFALTLVLAAVALFRKARKGRGVENTEPQDEVPVVDISDEQTLADELPSDSWREMAESLMGEGEFRLALRALYLGTLARLSEKGLVTVAAYKSNREYRDELLRRAHEKKDLIRLFTSSVSIFEGIWYGMHALSGDDVLSFAKDQERIGDYAR